MASSPVSQASRNQKGATPEILAPNAAAAAVFWPASAPLTHETAFGHATDVGLGREMLHQHLADALAFERNLAAEQLATKIRTPSA